MRLAAATVLLLAAAPLSAVAQPPSHAEAAQSPEIVHADADLEAGRLTTEGHGFGTATGRIALGGAHGSVYLDLIAVTWTDQQVVALLPPGLPAGAYHVEVTTRPRGRGLESLRSRIDVTFGVQGPKGDPGEAGPSGLNGIDGAPGPAGPQGSAGPQGPAGPAGSIGAVGPIGPPGAAGATGAAGPSGVVGTFTTPLTVTTLTAALQTLQGTLTIDAGNLTPTLFAEADSSLLLNSAIGTYAVVELRMVLDGVVIQTIKTEVVNYIAANLSNAWHLHTLKPLTAGTHELHIEARVLSTNGQVQINNNAGRLSALLLR